jgi:anti-anti-sigma factor
MDSSGVATLVEALQHCRRQGRDLRLVAPNDRVNSIFQIAKLDTIFVIVTSDEAGSD